VLTWAGAPWKRHRRRADTAVTQEGVWRDRLRSYRVILDDEVARINQGQAIELPVAGRHDTLLEIDGCSSPTIEFDAQPGEVIIFVCEPADAIRLGRPLRMPWRHTQI
jgi:hypothetical protein